MAYDIFWEKRGVYRRYSGFISSEELAESILAVEHDVRFDTIRYVINDFIACERIAYSPQKIMEISAIDGAAEQSNPNIRIAIVADKPDVRAVGEAYVAAGMNTFPTQLFWTVAEARAWTNEDVAPTFIAPRLPARNR